MASILDSDMASGIGQLLKEKRVRVPFYQNLLQFPKRFISIYVISFSPFGARLLGTHPSRPLR